MHTSDHVEAIANLILSDGDVGRAVALLESIPAHAPTGVRALSDLSAAYTVRAQRRDRASDLLRAHQAAQRALEIDPQHPEARFNLGLAGEMLHLPAPWDSYLELEEDSPWAREAEKRRVALRNERSLLAAGLWSLNRERLLDAVRSSDLQAVEELVEPFPAAAQRYLENELLPQWAAAQTKSYAEAKEALALAEAVAGALEKVTRDVYLVETVRAISRVSSPPRDIGAIRALRAGHRLFAEAREAERAKKPEEAEDLYAQARDLFTVGGSPLRAGAELGRLIAVFAQPYVSSVDALVPEIEALAQEAWRLGYRHVYARALWIKALCFFFVEDSRAVEALATYDDALHVFRRTNDLENMAAVRSRKSGVLRTLGEYELAWREAHQALGLLPAVVPLTSKHYVLGAAAAATAGLGDPETGLLYQDRSVELLRNRLGQPDLDSEAEIANLRTNLAVALRERARLHVRSERYEEAYQDLLEATPLAAVSDSQVRAALEARLQEVVAQRRLADFDPQGAIEALTRALALSPPEEFRTQRAEFLFQRAEAYLRSGQRPRAEADLKEGIEELQAEETAILSRRERGQGETLWSPYFSRFVEAYEELIQLLLEDDRDEKAFHYNDRLRSFEPLHLAQRLAYPPRRYPGLTEEGDSVELVALQAHLDPGTALLSYNVLEERTLVWVVTNQSFYATEIGLDRATLTTRARALRSAFEARQGERFETLLSDLARGLVVAPLRRLAEDGSGKTTVKRLVLVPDEALHGLPFAAMRLPNTNRYLIEDYIVSVAPSAALFVQSLLLDQGLTAKQAPKVLLVGDPAFDPTSDYARGLKRLRFAVDEVVRISELYTDPALLMKGEATVDSFLELAKTSEIVHVAGHAVANPEAPYRSTILLAPSPRHGGALTAEEMLATLELEATRLVVLSACDTAASYGVSPTGLAPLVRPLLTAGVPAVVGSLWNVNDATTPELLIAFHRHFRAGHDAAGALRQAQLDLLNSKSGGLTSSHSWGAFQVVGQASSPYPTIAMN